jgi:hypothetical protein
MIFLFLAEKSKINSKSQERKYYLSTSAVLVSAPAAEQPMPS